MKHLICFVALLLVIVGGFVGFGKWKWRQHQAITRQIEAEQDYVERVKQEAGER